MPGGSTRRRRLAGLFAALLSCALLAAAAPALADPTPWGTTGAAYDGGILCTQDGGARVPMARWLVDGQETFATADVVGTPAGDGPAPSVGPLTTLAAGTGGLDVRSIAVLAELIARYGTVSPARTAEVSAAVAGAFGSGSAQARCLGQQGTSTADLQALRAQAERYAGPYTVSATAPGSGAPGTSAAVTVTVRSAAGVPVPGVAVTVSGAGQSMTGSTGAQGVATVALTRPRVASSPLTATVAQRTGLLFAAGPPGAVAPGPPTDVTATTTLTTDLHPHPVLHVDVGGGLVAAQSPLTPTAQVSGTYGFAGSGTLTLAGPATPPADGSCSALPASAFAAAPNAWSQPFTFTGDGRVPTGSTPQLAAGCYVAGGSLTLSGVDPAATATAPFENAAIVDVVGLAVRRSSLPVLALPGRVATTVTVDGADDASVSSAATVLGPVAPRDGRCDTVRWAGARVAGAVDGRAVDGDARAQVLQTPPLTTLGCYALQVRTTVEQDGRTLTVQSTAGTPGGVVFVVRPSFAVADGTYDTTLGTPMSGRVTVSGTYRYPATVTVRLRSAAPRFDGCRAASFTTGSAAAAATTRTTGDGTFAFRTPAPRANTCYAVDASLQMVDAAGVRVAGPPPGAATIFLAGIAPAAPRGPDVLHHDGSIVRSAVTLLALVVTVLALAGSVIVRVAARRARGEWRPDALREDLLAT